MPLLQPHLCAQISTCERGVTGGAFLLFGLMLATAAVLVTGLALMARGGEPNRKYGNKMMALRVMLQAAALAVMAVLLLTKK